MVDRGSAHRAGAQARALGAAGPRPLRPSPWSEPVHSRPGRVFLVGHLGLEPRHRSSTPPRRSAASPWNPSAGRWASGAGPPRRPGGIARTAPSGDIVPNAAIAQSSSCRRRRRRGGDLLLVYCTCPAFRPQQHLAPECASISPCHLLTREAKRAIAAFSVPELEELSRLPGLDITASLSNQRA